MQQIYAFLFLKLSFMLVLPDPKNLMIHLDFENDLLDKSGNNNHGKMIGPDTITYKFEISINFSI